MFNFEKISDWQCLQTLMTADGL